MTPQEAYEHCNKTGEEEFTFTKGKKALWVLFLKPYDIGEVWIPAEQKAYPVQMFYDSWEAAVRPATPGAA